MDSKSPKTWTLKKLLQARAGYHDGSPQARPIDHEIQRQRIRPASFRTRIAIVISIAAVALSVFLATRAPVGEPPGASPTPAFPSPSSTKSWDSATVESAITISTAQYNEATLAYFTEGVPGWITGASLAFGSEWRHKDQSWAWDKYGYSDEFWFPYFEWWAVILHEKGSTAAGWIDVKDMEWQILYRNESSWVRYQPKNNAMGWGAVYVPKGSGYEVTRTVPTVVAGSDGGISMKLPLNTAPHFTANQSRYKVPRMGEIEGVIATMLVRSTPGNPPGFKGMVHVGGDPKPSAHPRTDGMTGGAAYTPFAVSSSIRATSSWRRVTASNIARPHEAFNRRMMTAERFREVPPLLH